MNNISYMTVLCQFVKRKCDQDYTFRIKVPRVREHLSYAVYKIDSSCKQNTTMLEHANDMNSSVMNMRCRFGDNVLSYFYRDSPNSWYISTPNGG